MAKQAASGTGSRQKAPGKGNSNASGGATGKVAMPKGAMGTHAAKAIKTGGKGKPRSSSKGNMGTKPGGSGGGSSTC